MVNPVAPTSWFASALRSTSSPSLVSSRLRATSRPKAAYSSSLPPLPTPISTRPPLSRSTTETSSASRTGFSSGSTVIAVDSRIRLVRAAACARNVHGEGSPPPPRGA